MTTSDAGDGINDANFEEDVADNSVLRLLVYSDSKSIVDANHT